MPLRRNKLLVLLSLFTVPLFAFPFLFVEIYNKRKYAMFALSFLMGLLAMQVMPVADLYRHTLVYYELKEASLSEFFDFLIWHVDYVFYIILYVAGRLEIDFSIVRLLWVSVAYGIYFYIFNDVVSRKSSLSRKHYMLVFLFFYFFIPLVDLAAGMRFYFANTLMVLAFYELYIKKRKVAYFIMFISCMIHFAMLPLVLILILFNNIALSQFKMFILILSLFFYFIQESVWDLLMNIIPFGENYVRVLSGYMENPVEVVNNSVYTRVFQFTSYLPFILSFLMLLFSKDVSRVSNMLISLFTFIMLFSLLPVSQRYYSFFVIVTFIDYWDTGDVCRQKWYFILIFISVLFLFVMRFYYWRMLLPIPYILEYLYTPTCLLLSHHFNEIDILLNVDTDGTLIKQF